jgi:hypothetical protein
LQKLNAPKLVPAEIGNSSGCMQIYALNLHFTGLAKGEIASLSGAGDDPKSK